MDLIYFKFLNGEEVIAYAKKVIGGWYIERPAMLVNLEDFKVGLATWLPYTTLSISGNIPDASILLIAQVEEEMVKYYNAWIGQGSKEVDIDEVKPIVETEPQTK